MAERKDKSPSHGLGRWLAAAPPEASFREVVEASQQFDSPDDWLNGEQSDLAGWSG